MLFTPHLDKTQSNFVQIYAFYLTFGQNGPCDKEGGQDYPSGGNEIF